MDCDTPDGQPIPVTHTPSARAVRGRTSAAPLLVALTCAAIVWVGLVLAAPVALASGRAPVLTFATYHAGALVCHQRPERSFHFAGVQLPVCARCFGLYLAGAAGLAAGWLGRTPMPARTVRTLLAIAAVPIAATVALEWSGAIATTNAQRMATGLPLGFVAGLVVVRSLFRPVDAL
jgi:uncharacterized membrane protein